MRISKATPKAIRYACKNYHYSRSTPQVRYGFNVFNDNDEWCGVILYGTGANRNINKPFNCLTGEVYELVRVALNGKQEITSRAVAMSLKELHKIAPQIKVVVSYADIDQGHCGIIYQATNWIYLGKTNVNEVHSYIINGKPVHNKTLSAPLRRRKVPITLENIKKYINKNAEPKVTKGKHKYIYCFNKKLRKEWLKKAKPYPK